MSGLSKTSRVFAPVWVALTIPATLAHELLHALASAPWAQEVTVSARPRSFDVACLVEWREDTPRAAIALAHLAPVLVGLVAALVSGAIWYSSGGQLPSSTAEMVTWAVAAVWWAIFTWPSADDLNIPEADA